MKSYEKIDYEYLDSSFIGGWKAKYSVFQNKTFYFGETPLFCLFLNDGPIKSRKQDLVEPITIW